MSERAWYLIMAGWTLCVVAFLIWVYFDTKKFDKVQEALDIDTDRLMVATAEQLARIYPKPTLYKVTQLPPITRPTFPNKEWQDRARQAESLGFMDPADEKLVS